MKTTTTALTRKQQHQQQQQEHKNKQQQSASGKAGCGHWLLFVVIALCFFYIPSTMALMQMGGTDLR